MSILTVISLGEEASAVKERLEKHYSDNYIPAEGREGVWFVSSNDLTSKIAENLGFDKEEKITGIVIKNAGWYGYANRSIWEWAERYE